MYTLTDFNFGEYEARRELIRSEDYFFNTFQTPTSFSLNNIKASKDYIIIGKKGFQFKV
jgi:hypothetical protein